MKKYIRKFDNKQDAYLGVGFLHSDTPFIATITDELSNIYCFSDKHIDSLLYSKEEESYGYLVSGTKKRIIVRNDGYTAFSYKHVVFRSKKYITTMTDTP